ncbi:ABC transporter permease [Couchioplanes caeruleus]|uniref:Polyketide antibiotic transporter n=2 Tax=Couchioplanes caeruleus TaxID=56438 RepID=A0A1K0GK45_9ACTN|nr:polyketide antibiotic transporter [Couchioplanes caeruleus]OJF11372.1 polyketide antibiotic transporter [Couchioplanes caeruleus subsp. caeruleus]ROP28391.1 ABC-2 type transport system permease protein [Couchioplanes caeruleus]
MSTRALTAARRPGAAVQRRPAGALAGLAARLIRRGGLVVVALAAGMSALVAATYEQLMADSAVAGGLQSLATNPAIRTLFGEPVALDDPGGFTVWRTGTVLAALIGVWCVLTTTRITRGEEDAGRWDILLAGRVPLQAALATHLLVVGAVPVAFGAAVSASLAATGTDMNGAVVHGAGLSLLGVFFAATAALSAQIHTARSAATGTAIAVLAVTLLARMVGDGVDTVAWLRWLSPFGLLELSQPYARNRWAPLLVLAAAAILLATAAVAVAGRRDVGGALRSPAATRASRTALLGSVEGFALRRLLPPLGGWAAGVASYFLLIGLIADTMTRFLTDNPAFADAAVQAGFTGLATVEGYAATIFALLALPVGGFAASRVDAFAKAEAGRHLALLAAQPVSRIRLLAAETIPAVIGAVVLTTVAGLATWLGVTATPGDLGLTAALGGVWNTLPLALLSVGAAVLAFGWLPRAVTAIGAVPTVGGFLLLVIAQSVNAPQWVVDVSPFAHLAAVPHTAPNWPATAAMTVVTLILVAAGAIGYRRRDLLS